MSLAIKDHILAVISEIPKTHVTSYGTVGEIVSGLINKPTSGWEVGRILSGCNPTKIQQYPRWRVVNAQGYISALKLGTRGLLQINILQQEGVMIIDGYIDMKQYGWKIKDKK